MVLVAGVSPAGADQAPRISSTFIDPRAVVDWDGPRWDQELDDMADAGITTVVLQATADESSDGPETYYPSSVPGTHQATRSDGTPADVVGLLLDRAAAHGLTVRLGLYRDDRAQRFAPDDAITGELAADQSLTRQLATDLWSQHWDLHATIVGWYLPAEVNTNYVAEPARSALITYYADVVTFLHGTANDYPVMVSPYFNPEAGVTAAQYGQLWSDILAQAPVDVIALQDGTGDIPGEPRDAQEVHTTLSTWFGALRDAVAASGRATQLWANLDLYEFTGGSASVKDLADHWTDVEGLVSGYTSFSFTDQIAPWTLGTAAYYAPFRLWNTTGTFAPGRPSAPTGLTMTPSGDGHQTLVWSASSPATGKYLAYYRVYRTGVGSDVYAATTWTTTATVASDDGCLSVVAFDTTGDSSPAATACPAAS